MNNLYSVTLTSINSSVMINIHHVHICNMISEKKRICVLRKNGLSRAGKDTRATSNKVVVLGGTYHMRKGGVQGLTTNFGQKTTTFVFASFRSRSLQNVYTINTIKLLSLRVLPYLGVSKIGCQADFLYKQKVVIVPQLPEGEREGSPTLWYVPP